MKLAIRSVREATNYEEGMKSLTKAYSVLDRVVARGTVHKNFAANRKSTLSALVKKLKTA